MTKAKKLRQIYICKHKNPKFTRGQRPRSGSLNSFPSLFSNISVYHFFFNSYYLFSHYCDFPPDKSYTRWPKLHYALCTFGSGAVFHGLGWTSLVPVRGNLNATAYNHILYINGVGSFFYFNISKHAQRQIHRKNVLVLTSTPSNTFQIK